MSLTAFWIFTLAFLSAYSYFVYPLVLLVARKAPFASRRVRSVPFRPAPASGSVSEAEHEAFEAALKARQERDDARFQPRISLLITAHNEEDRIRAKIENCLRLEYDPDHLEIIVCSDASTDGTEAILAAYPRVRVVRVLDRKGKEHAQKQGILGSNGEILVFTDVATLLDPDALRLLARNFRDPAVGALSSTDKMIDENGMPSGEGMYVRYEMLLRRLESDVRGLVGLSGSFFAARRSVCLPWAENLPSDFNTVMNCVKLGYRAVSDDNVFGYYRDIKHGQSEFQRKVRTLVRGITAFFANLDMLDFRRFGFFSFQLFSHKLMRWLAPVFMILLVPATIAGIADGDSAAYVVAAMQVCFYGLALVGFAFSPAQRNLLVKVPYFFAQVNTAILAAWYRYLRGERITLWAPSKR